MGEDALNKEVKRLGFRQNKKERGKGLMGQKRVCENPKTRVSITLHLNGG